MLPPAPSPQTPPLYALPLCGVRKFLSAFVALSPALAICINLTQKNGLNTTPKKQEKQEALELKAKSQPKE